jgi:hypothetical protein
MHPLPPFLCCLTPNPSAGPTNRSPHPPPPTHPTHLNLCFPSPLPVSRPPPAPRSTNTPPQRHQHGPLRAHTTGCKHIPQRAGPLLNPLQPPGNPPRGSVYRRCGIRGVGERENLQYFSTRVPCVAAWLDNWPHSCTEGGWTNAAPRGREWCKMRAGVGGCWELGRVEEEEEGGTVRPKLRT